MLRSKALTEKVLVLGIDGMDPRFSKAMIEEGNMPNLKKLQNLTLHNPVQHSLTQHSLTQHSLTQYSLKVKLLLPRRNSQNLSICPITRIGLCNGI